MLKTRRCILFLIVAAIVPVVFAQTPDFSGLKVMVNPGHGGQDSDDRGMPNGFWESESNLTKGIWLKELLEARGCGVIMSRVENRTEDDLPLSQIAAIANQNEVDLFISIHSNAGNQSSNYPLTIYNGKSDSPAIPEARTWAIRLWEQLITNRATFWTHEDPHYIGDLTLNPGWTSGYGVLYPLQIPGIISEGSFHDYGPEMDRLLNLDYRRQEAYNILYAMISYFNLDGTEALGNISGIIRDSLLVKEHYSIAGSPDKHLCVNGALVELLETGERYRVDTLNTGFYMFDSIAPGNYHLVYSATDYFNDTIPVEVFAHRFSYVNQWLKADKTMAPKVISHSPVETQATPCFDPVTITFNMNMDSASVADAFSIEPTIPGNFLWDRDYLRVNFQPSVPYDTGTTYLVTLDTLAMHQWGVNLDTLLQFSFVTGDRNRYHLESAFPTEGQDAVSPFLQFRLIFDAPLNNSSLIGAVTIFDGDGIGLTTRGATILEEAGKGIYYFSPSMELEYNKEYRLMLAGSIRDEANIPLVDTTWISFSTMHDPGTITILDEFDDPSAWSIDLSESQGIDEQSFIYRWTKNYRSGSASMLLRYHFTGEGAVCVLVPTEELVLDPGLENAGMWIWGDLGHQRVVAGFDNGTEKELCGIDFSGWGYCVTGLPDGAGSLSYIKVVSSPGGSSSGDLYFDALHQPGSTVSVAEQNSSHLLTYPNPVTGEELHLEGIQEGPLRYHIYDIAGNLLQEGVLEAGVKNLRLNARTKEADLFIINFVNQNVAVSLLLKNAR